MAQVTMYEQEPNNTPLNGNTFKAPMVILGTMQDSDQDMFVWDLSDADAGYLWDLELNGLPERLTKVDFMHLTFTEDGTGVTKVDKLFSISNHGGTTAVKKSGLVSSIPLSVSLAIVSTSPNVFSFRSLSNTKTLSPHFQTRSPKP